MQLFDLETDPGEQHDVAAAYPEILARLKRLYDGMVMDLPEMAGAKMHRR
jgi:hypothetical protein